MTNLDIAITSLEQELEALNLPKEGTVDWFTVRAKALGLSLLKAARLSQLGEDLPRFDAFRKDIRLRIVASNLTVVDPAPAPEPVPVPEPTPLPGNNPPGRNGL